MFCNVHSDVESRLQPLRWFTITTYAVRVSQNHGMLRVWGDLVDHLVPTSLPWAGTLHSRPDYSRPWTLPRLGHPRLPWASCSVFYHPWSKEFLSKANLNFSPFCSNPLINFMALLQTCSNSSVSFLCWGHQSWLQYSGWSLTRAEGQNPLPCPAAHTPVDAAQDTFGFLGCECTLMAHVEFFTNHHSQVSPQGCSQPLLHQGVPGLPQPRSRTLHLACLSFMRFPSFSLSSLSRSLDPHC